MEEHDLGDVLDHSDEDEFCEYCCYPKEECVCNNPISYDDSNLMK